MKPALLLALLIISPVCAAQSKRDSWQVDGKPVFEVTAALRAKANNDREPILIRLPEMLEDSPFDHRLAKPREYAEFTLTLREAPPKVITYTTVLVNGKPVQHKIRIFYQDVLRPQFFRDGPGKTYYPRFRTLPGENLSDFTMIGEGYIATNGEYETSTSDDEVTHIRTYHFLIVRMLVFKTATKEAVYAYNFAKHELYEREIPKQ